MDERTVFSQFIVHSVKQSIRVTTRLGHSPSIRCALSRHRSSLYCYCPQAHDRLLSTVSKVAKPQNMSQRSTNTIAQRLMWKIINFIGHAQCPFRPVAAAAISVIAVVAPFRCCVGAGRQSNCHQHNTTWVVIQLSRLGLVLLWSNEWQGITASGRMDSGGVKRTDLWSLQ